MTILASIHAASGRMALTAIPRNLTSLECPLDSPLALEFHQLRERPGDNNAVPEPVSLTRHSPSLAPPTLHRSERSLMPSNWASSATNYPDSRPEVRSGGSYLLGSKLLQIW